MNRALAEHEARLIASQILAGTWSPPLKADYVDKPAFVNARGKHWTRNAIAQQVLPPAPYEADHQRAVVGLAAIREEVTPHMLRHTCIASLFAAGADQEYVADQAAPGALSRTSASTRRATREPSRALST